MTPFAIAGVQMHLQHGDNLEAMRHRLQVHDAPLSLGADGGVQRAVRVRPRPAAGPAPARAGRGIAARHGARVRPLAGAGLALREPRRPDLQHHAGNRPERRGGRPLPQDVPLRAARGGGRTGRRVLRVRRARRRPVRRAQLLRPLVPGDGAHGDRDGGRGDPAPGDDPHHRPGRRSERGQGQCRHVPVLRVRHQRPRRRRQRPVLRARPVGPGASTSAARPRSWCRSRSTSSRSAASACAACAPWASR